MFYGSDNLFKVRKTMARLLTVVNERKKIRNEYRRHLEEEYIAKQKEEEAKVQEAKYVKEREAGRSTGMMPDEVKTML